MIVQLVNFIYQNLELCNMNYINSLDDLKQAINHPYRSGEYLSDGTQIFEVSEDMNENECLIESYEGEPDALFYAVNWEGESLYTECGIEIESIY